MGLLTGRGMVRMKKGDVTHDFALVSVPHWEKRGWSVDDSQQEPSEEHERLAELTTQANKELAKNDADASAQQTTGTNNKK
jgi:hypothetical protein